DSPDRPGEHIVFVSISLNEPAVGQGLLHDDFHPRAVCVLERRLGASLEKIPRRLYGIVNPFAIAPHFESPSNGYVLPRPADTKSRPDAFLSQSCNRINERVVLQRFALGGHGVDLVK